MPEAMTDRRLTSFSHGAGCGCKLGPDDLLTVLGSVTMPPASADLLVAADTGDDAAVYRLPSGEGLIATLDFFTPIVDDPYDWGRIAATNALSDVYAMGGRPLLALNIVNWPVDDLPLDMLARVLQGGADVAGGRRRRGGRRALDHRSGAEVRDGRDRPRGTRRGRPELDRARGGGAVPHEAARPRDRVDRDQAGHRRRRPRRRGDRADDDDEPSGRRGDADTDAEAATDVTGFGLLGHLHRMLLASGTAAELDAGAIPLLDSTDPRPRSERRRPERNEAEPRLRPAAHGLRRSPRARAMHPRRRPDLGRPPDRGEASAVDGGGVPRVRGAVRDDRRGGRAASRAGSRSPAPCAPRGNRAGRAPVSVPGEATWTGPGSHRTTGPSRIPGSRSSSGRRRTRSTIRNPSFHPSCRRRSGAPATTPSGTPAGSA